MGEAGSLGVGGPAIAIGAMALATYLCRVSGVLLMSRFRITPRLERALAALPGSIIAATVLPIALRSGADAFAGIAAGLVVMRLTRSEVAALLCGLAVVAAVRFLHAPA